MENLKRVEIKWIPVNEQLPPEAKSVLFCTWDYVAEGTYKKGYWHQYRWDLHIDPSKVIAWAEKPEVWNEKTN